MLILTWLLRKKCQKNINHHRKKIFNGDDLSIYENLTKLECLLVAANIALEKYKG